MRKYLVYDVAFGLLLGLALILIMLPTSLSYALAGLCIATAFALQFKALEAHHD